MDVEDRRASMTTSLHWMVASVFDERERGVIKW